MPDKLLRVAVAAEQWEASRLRVRERCEAAAAELSAKIGGGIDQLSYRDLFLPRSKSISRLGERLRQGILRLERTLARELTEGVEAEEALRFRRGVLWTKIQSVADDPLSGRGGLARSDMVRLFIGGWSTAGTVAVGSRAAPTVLTATGLGAVALPATVLGGMVCAGLTARTLLRRKRRELHEVLADTIARIVLGEDGSPSVITNHLTYLDKLYAPLLETEDGER